MRCGRLDLESLSFWLRMVLKIGAMMNKDPKARQDELKGFDNMDKASIAPIVDRARALMEG